MNAMKQRWLFWAMRIDALSFRERVLVFLAIAGVAVSVIFVGLIEPVLKRQEQMLQITAGLQQEISAQHEQLAEREQINQSEHDSELNRLRDEAAAIENELKARERGFIPPERMVVTLKALLAEQPGLTLLSLETAPVRPALAAADGGETEPETKPATADKPLYKHGFTVRVEGAYANLTAYLARLERMPWTVQWESVQVDASRHPHLVMTLKLNTLSREPTWARL